MLGNLIGGFIIIIIGVSLIPTVADQVEEAKDSGNVTGATDTIVGLVPLFFAIGFMSAGVSINAQ